MMHVKQEVSLLELTANLTKRKKAIGIIFFFCLLMATFYVFLTPNIYKAQSRILPPLQRTGGMSAIMAQMGGLAELAGFSGSSTNGELLIGFLQSDTIVDRIIDRFDLMAVYDQPVRLKMREMVTSEILNTMEDVKSGIVTVAVLDEDPIRAADMANTFVLELKNRMQSLAIGEAAQRRLFFEEQAQQAFKNLGNAEDEMLRYQEKSGMVAVEPQLEAMLSSIASLRAQITSKEVEIVALKTYARKDNPNLKLAESQLSAMKNELAKLEARQKSVEQKNEETLSLPSMKQAPSLGLEYQRRLRDVKFATAMYELMLKQLEAARLDESRENMQIQILDVASPPDYKFKPKCLLILIFASLLGIFLGVLWALIGFYWDSLKADPKQAEYIAVIKNMFVLKRK